MIKHKQISNQLIEFRRILRKTDEKYLNIYDIPFLAGRLDVKIAQQIGEWKYLTSNNKILKPINCY